MTYTVPIANTAPIIPIYFGRSTGVVETDSSIITPRYIPLPPIPAIARPTMSAFMVGAAPQTVEPISKMATLSM